MSQPQTMVPAPSKEVLEFLQWALGAAVNEFYRSADDHTDCDAAAAWLDEIEKVCGYDDPS